MKKVLSSIFFTMLLPSANVAQSKFYFTCCEKGDSLYQASQFLKAAQSYGTASVAFRGKLLVNDRYNLARSWAMANVPDSALGHLEKLVYNDRYAAYKRLKPDPAFNSLHTDMRWKSLLDTVLTIVAAHEAKFAELGKLYEPELAARLDSIYKTDQLYRKQLEEFEKRYGYKSQEMTVLWGKIRYQDSINLITVKQVLDTRGWLGPDIVHGGSQALFLVIQHSDLNTQLQYLPMMREAAKNGKLDQGGLAMLEDRVLLRQNKKQIYGTQIRRDSLTGKRFVAPLIDPENVDKRRAEIGLGPIADYVSNWDLAWDPEAYKREMAVREK